MNIVTRAPASVSRFASYLRNNNLLADYMQTLMDAFNAGTVSGLMCRDTLNVGWRGEVSDCDFNAMLNLGWRDATGQAPVYVWDVDLATVEGREVRTADHCFGCTAGAGSSCGGALVG